jgi:hypothetical protein
VFCEKVIEDKEGVLTLVRIIDRVTQTGAGPEAPERWRRSPSTCGP